MAATSQQPVSVMVYGGTQHTPTVIQAVQQPQMVPVPIQRGDKMLYGQAHKILGIIQMFIGCTCFCLSVLGFSIGTGNYTYYYFGAGIYSGIFFVIPGFLGYMAYKHNSQCCVVGCMVMNIIGSCVAVIGISFASIEIGSNYDYEGKGVKMEFQAAKRGIVLTGCIFEFIITIVHCSFTCASCCDCCLPRQAAPLAPQVTGGIVVQQVPQTNIMYPGQVYAPYQSSMPQQQYLISQQPSPAGQYQVSTVQSYPPQQYFQGVNPQGEMNPPEYNPTFSHSSPHNNPPPYSEFATPDKS